MGLEDLYKYKLPKENISAKYIEYKESILQFFVNFGKISQRREVVRVNLNKNSFYTNNIKTQKQMVEGR